MKRIGKLTIFSLVIISSFFFYTNEVKATGNRDDIVRTAKNYLGVPYVTGGTTPSGFDCSGLVQYVFKLNGYNLPRVTIQQENAGIIIPVSEAKPGDLYFFGNKGNTTHDAIAIGNGDFIHAPQPGQNVKITNIKWYTPSFAVRILTDDIDYPHPAIDESIATVAYIPGYGVFGFRSNGENIPDSNLNLKHGTQWKTFGSKMINGEEMFSIGTDYYLPRRYTNLDASGITINYIPDYGIKSYRKDGSWTGKYLSTGTSFQTFGFEIINDKIMYLVGSNEYVPKQYTQFGNGK